MRYLYYIIVIFVLATAGFALLRHDKASVDVSRPAVTINDRIITENELQDRLAAKPHDMTDQQYIDSLIMQELLIQEALKQNIHKEESFRRSVENFYEQSLVKILLDRKSRETDPEVTQKEIEKYRKLSSMEVEVIKRVYTSIEDARQGNDPAEKTIASPFAFLSDSLQCTLINLKQGETSAPVQTDEGYVIYSLKQLRPLKSTQAVPDMDNSRIKNLIADRKRQQLYKQWTEELRKKADIWRRK